MPGTKNTPRLAVFDCDGTLVDSLSNIVAGFQRAAEQVGLAKLPPERIRQVIGLNLDQCVRTLYPTLDKAGIVGMVAAYRQTHLQRQSDGYQPAPLYDGIKAVLAALDDAGVLLGVATGKSRRGLDETLAFHGLDGRFVTLQTADDGPGKPHPGMLQRAIEEAGVRAGEAVMIGDTTHDAQMAASAGVAMIAVSWGYHTIVELEGVGFQALARQPAELVDHALRLLGPVGVSS